MTQSSLAYELIRQCSHIDVALFRALRSSLEAFSADAAVPLRTSAFPRLLGAALGLSARLGMPSGDAFALLITTKTVHGVLHHVEEQADTYEGLKVTLHLTDKLLQRAALPPLCENDPINGLKRLLTSWHETVDLHGASLQTLHGSVAKEIGRRQANERNKQAFRRDPRMTRDQADAEHLQLEMPAPESHLLPREVEVLVYLSKGFSVADMVSLSGLRAHAVNSILRAIYRKLAVGSRAEAAVLASKMGLV